MTTQVTETASKKTETWDRTFAYTRAWTHGCVTASIVLVSGGAFTVGVYPFAQLLVPQADMAVTTVWMLGCWMVVAASMMLPEWLHIEDNADLARYNGREWAQKRMLHDRRLLRRWNPIVVLISIVRAIYFRLRDGNWNWAHGHT